MRTRESIDISGDPSICVILHREGGHYCSACPVIMVREKPQRAIIHDEPDLDDPGLSYHFGPKPPTTDEPPKGPWTPYLEQILYSVRRGESLSQESLDLLRSRCPCAYEILDRAVSMAQNVPSSRAPYQVINLMPALVKPNGSNTTTVLGDMRVAVPLDESGLLYFIGEQI
jgi:hypothetical protein